MSSFVLIEPSLYDLMLLILFTVCFISSLYIFQEDHVLPLLILCLFLLCNLISLYFIKELGNSVEFIGITFYLAVTWIALVGLIPHFKIQDVELILKGYLVAALLSALIGITAYFHLIPYSDLFLMYGRAKALFKDPNVFGPFLVLPALFALSMTEKEKIKNMTKYFYYGLFLILFAGVIFSFSRAAWGNMGISLGIYLLFIKKELRQNRIKTFWFLLIIGLPSLIILIHSPMVEELFKARLSLQDYDNDRFSVQREAIYSGLLHPFGNGSGQAEILFQYSTHSLYARLITENGLIGLLSFITFCLLSVIRTFTSYTTSRREGSEFFLVIFASLIGLAFNSFFVDTLHWRHFWLLLALAWCAPLKRGDDG